jgi:hypothetical protein
VVSADSLTDYNFAGGADLCLDVMDRIDHRALYFLDANFATWYVDGLRDTLESPAWDEPARRSIR